uniref:Synaptotagmin like 2 n=1 Tax=Cynoglossus semilaevis TaxID=244447 RepID=A0A3P8WUT3_CYNSE
VAALTMIDLSFLSEEEQEAILSVLKRDAELKKSEQQRVQKLQQTVSNKEQLKYLTGEWFYETKQLRHQDSIHGSDIIRASIKHTYKPMTICEFHAGAQQEVTEDESQEEAKQEDISKKGREVPQGLQTNITSVDNKTTITTTLSSQTVCDSSSKDGDTYRANPVLIYEEADDLLTVLESKETIITHVSSSVPVSDQEHQDVSGSMSSIYPTDYGDIEVQGNIQFAMSYIQKLGEFHIFVVHCQDLAVGDTKKSRTDPYVKCYLLPEKTDLGKKKTTVKKKTFNPEYNEFKVNKEVLKTQNLNVSVWHNDTFGRNSFLGEVELDLSEWDFNNTRINEYMLKSRVRLSFLQQKIVMTFTHLLSLLFSITRTETGEVQIWVKDFLTTSQSASPLLVCSTVLPDTSKKSRQKTRVVKRTANPMFNHTMVYDGFRSEDLREACVEITVWDHDRLNSQFIGGLRLGLGTGKSYGLNAIWMDSTAAEANLWQRMLESDGEWVEDLLPLRMFGIAKCI